MERSTLALRYALLWLLLAAGTLALGGWLSQSLGAPGMAAGLAAGGACAFLLWRSIDKEARAGSP